MKQHEPMEPHQEAHLTRIKEEFLVLVDAKYRKGQAEHGGNLQEKPLQDLTDLAVAEAVDQVVYLLTLREQLRREFL